MIEGFTQRKLAIVLFCIAFIPRILIGEDGKNSDNGGAQLEADDGSLTNGIIQEQILDKSSPVVVRAHPAVSTTLEFPGPIEAPIGAYYITPDDEGKVAGDWFLEFQPGNNFLTINPIRLDSPPRNLNIRYKGQIYVFMPYVTERPIDATALVRMVDLESLIDEASPPGPPPNEIVVRESPGSAWKSPSATELMGFLDEVKIIATLEEEQIPDFLEETNGLQVSVRENDLTEYGAFAIEVNRVVRSPSLDALGFFVTFINRTDRILLIEEENVFVRVNQQLYEAGISDVPVVIPPRTETVGFFAIYGDGEGGRAEVAVDNRFRVGASVAFRQVAGKNDG